MPQGDATAGSPTADDEKQLPVGTDHNATEAPGSSPGTDDTTASSAEQAAPVGDGDAKEQPVDELSKLRDKLVAGNPAPSDDDEGKAEGDEPKDKPETTPAAAEKDIPPKAEAPKPATAEAKKPEDTVAQEDPLHGFSPEQRRALGKAATARIHEKHSEARKAKEDLARVTKESEPLILRGRFLERFEQDPNVPLTPDEVKSGLRFTQLFKAGAPEALEALQESISDLKSRLGIQDEPQAQEIAPYEGELPRVYEEMMSVLGVDERMARTFAAVAQREQAKAKQKQQQPPQAQERTAPPKPAAAAPLPNRPQQPTPPQQPVSRWGYSLATENAAGEAVCEWLASQGVPEDQQTEYVQKTLGASLTKHARNGDLRSIPPEDRLRLVQIAHQKAVLKKAEEERARRDRPAPVHGGAASPAPKTASRGDLSPLDKLRRQKVAS